MTWKYIAVEEDGAWGIKEKYEDGSETLTFIAPIGETKEELIQDLKNMLEDISE